LKAELVELSGKVRDGIDEVERAARPAIGVIRDNPGTISSVAVTAGLVGFALELKGSLRKPIVANASRTRETAPPQRLSRLEASRAPPEGTGFSGFALTCLTKVS
jgi:hypothetical protein